MSRKSETQRLVCDFSQPIRSGSETDGQTERRLRTLKIVVTFKFCKEIGIIKIMRKNEIIDYKIVPVAVFQIELKWLEIKLLKASLNLKECIYDHSMAYI